MKVLNTFFQNKSDLIDVLEQIPVTSLEQLKTAHVKAVGKGWEGLILRKDTIYQGKRSKDMLKMKKFHDAEYKVQSVEVGPFRIIGDNGLEETIETVTNIIINHKGNKVSVGSGFSLEQRKYYFENKHYLKNATVNVQFFEETKDKQGNIRLRFPVIKYVYEDGRKI